jgi:hypothetical protein
MLAEEFADPDQGESSLGQFRWTIRGVSHPIGAEQCWAGPVLSDGADDRRDDEYRCVRVAVADGVQKAVECRDEGTLTHGVGVDDVDSEFQADGGGGQVSDGPGHELIELALATNA